MSETTMQYKTIKELDELRLVGFRVLCSGDQYLVEISKASLRLSKRISEIKQVINPNEQFGAFIVENETADEDGYWVCVEVKEYKDIPTDMVTLTIPAQRYAVIRHKGSNYIERFYDWKDTERVDVELLDTIE
jgi:predicted transcriptional regulator YdeE